MAPPKYENSVGDHVKSLVEEQRASSHEPWNSISKVSYEVGPDHTGDLSITFMIEFATEPLPLRGALRSLEFEIKDWVWAKDDENRVKFVYFRYRRRGEQEAEQTSEDVVEGLDERQRATG